jgi:hypothetical protein
MLRTLERNLKGTNVLILKKEREIWTPYSNLVSHNFAFGQCLTCRALEWLSLHLVGTDIVKKYGCAKICDWSGLMEREPNSRSSTNDTQ